MSSRSFNPRYVLRQVSNGLLEDMFEIHRLAIDVDWSAVSETKIEPIFAAWQSLDETPRRNIEMLLRDIHSMAGELGQRAIIEEARRRGETELIRELSEYDSRHDVAMWTALKKPEIWEVASHFARADRTVGGRYSQRRIGLPPAMPDASPENLKSLSSSLSAFYSAMQARGRRCVAEHFVRADGTHYVFANLDDYRKQYLKLVDGGEFKKACETLAFEIIFVYDPNANTLDVDAQGGKAVHEPLQTIFARVFLGIDLPPEDPASEPFTLDVLLDPTFRFPTNPADGILSVTIDAARVRVMGTKDRLTLEPGTHAEPTNFSDMIDRYIDNQKLPRSVMQVERAILLFKWADNDGNTHEFDVRITRPNRSNLKSLGQDERELAEKYLREWGIDCAIASEVAIAAA